MADDSTPIAPDEVLGAPSGTPGQAGGPGEAPEAREAVNEPAKVLRIGSMVKTLLDEVLMNDPYVRLGRLRGELYSSVNLALDTRVPKNALAEKKP